MITTTSTDVTTSSTATSTSGGPATPAERGGAVAGPTLVRRGGEDYARAHADLLPTGPAWDRDPDTDLMRLVRGQAEVWGLVDGRAADLLERETDPRFAAEMLADWERAFGLPEPITLFETVETFAPFSFGPSSFGGARGRIEPPATRHTTRVTGFRPAEPLSIPERRRALVAKMTGEGGQSRAYFTAVAAALGYEIEIREYSPFQFGLSSFGGPRGRVQGPLVRFFWRVAVHGARVARFQFGASSFGRARILALRRAEDLESVLRREAPAHTTLILAYDDARRRVVRFAFGRSRFGNDPVVGFAPA